MQAVIYEYPLGGRNPCFALIGAVYGVGSQFEEGFHNGINRVIGTLVGGLLVIPFHRLYSSQPFGIPDWKGFFYTQSQEPYHEGKRT